LLARQTDGTLVWRKSAHASILEEQTNAMPHRSGSQGVPHEPVDSYDSAS
jgi:hypothetical protein